MEEICKCWGELAEKYWRIQEVSFDEIVCVCSLVLFEVRLLCLYLHCTPSTPSLSMEIGNMVAKFLECISAVGFYVCA